MPPGICGVSMKKELEYWHLRETLVEPCCWERYCSGVDRQTIIAKVSKVSKLELTENQLMETLTGFARFRLTVWWLMYRPHTSTCARAYSIVSTLFIAAATVGCCLETITELQDLESADAFENRCNVSSTFFIADVDHLIPLPSTGLRVLDYACNAFFTVQLVGRVLVTPELLAFLRSPITVINILALIPFYMLVVVYATSERCDIYKFQIVIQTAYLLSIIRVFRVFEILAHFEPFLILVRAIRRSLYELAILLIVVLACIFLFGVLIFYADGRRVDHKARVNDVPVGVWLAFITITSVGYGDFVPGTITGYVIVGACALVGVVLLALTIPIVSNSFSFFYDNSRTLKQKPVPKEDVEKTQVLLRRRQSAKTFPMEDGDEVTSLSQGSSVSIDATAAKEKSAKTVPMGGGGGGGGSDETTTLVQ